ncbi:MAG: 5'-nucleotidase/2',3'-cyclic phosphodiesterase related esterase [Candidatus Methanohalarchaeum thermophilum]|uniref:5'-nucleotidase/2',3'-cyclic phosphodiesterase related esterase n=1 Tax=Methanohalarchaeum thermophilum TaxID=1903181 RepID=A0A1Q6DX85_METT1|nr:MAG: 5'-nucleotidase/2',3'-cyclic phosphodiesterase related esterase [Candidatus Methanohalarchaeum thermophilum]
MEPHQELFWKDGDEVYRETGGLARISSFIENKFESSSRAVFLDNGDTFHGTYVPVKNKGIRMAEVMNELGIDAMTLHWEFAYGPERVKELEDELSYPILAINCYREEDEERLFDPYKIIERNGLKIGIIGIAATIVDKTMPKEFSEGIYFTLGDQELPYFINLLKEEENVDLILVLSHLGFPQEARLAKEVDGIDVLLSGHTHNRLYEASEINNTIIYQSGCHGSFIGELNLKMKDNKIKDYRHILNIIDKSIEEDKEITETINKIKEPYKDYLSKKVGKSIDGLHRYNVMESKMDNLLLKSIRDFKNTQLAFSNGWRYGSPIPPDSEITVENLWQIVPANPPVSTCDLKGKEIWDMMEENLEKTFSRNPYNQMGGYIKRCIGLNIYFKVENPKNERIQEIYIGDNKIQEEKYYSTTYLSTQAVPRKYGKNRKTHQINAIEALKRYIKNNSPIKIGKTNSIVPI